MRRVVLLAGSVLICMFLTVVPTVAAQPSVSSTSCGTSREPESVSSEALEACEVKVYPLTSTTVLPNSDKEYIYERDGEELRALFPPESLDPATATSEELRAYGFLVPKGAEAEKMFMEAASHSVSVETPPSRLLVFPDESGVVGTENWSGVVDEKGEGKYTEVAATWKQPADAEKDDCSNNADSIWPGIGATNIGQDGTEQKVTGWGENEFWYETVGEINTGGMVKIPMKVKPGQYAEATADYVGGNKYKFQVFSETEEKWSGIFEAKGTFGGNYAEDIVERPLHEGKFYQLENYNWVNMTAYTNDYGVGELPHYRNWMYEGLETEKDLLATAENVYEGHSFKDEHIRCKAE